MPLQRQPPERPQRLPSRVTLDRRRAMGAVFQPPPACPLRLRAVLDPWGAVLRTELHRRPHHPLVLPSQVILARSRALAAMALQQPECPIRYRAVLDRWRAVAAMALQRPSASAATTLHGPRVGRSMALQRPPACLLRLRAVLGRWRAVAATALQRRPLGRRRPPSHPLLERWAAIAL